MAGNSYPAADRPTERWRLCAGSGNELPHLVPKPVPQDGDQRLVLFAQTVDEAMVAPGGQANVREGLDEAARRDVLGDERA